MLCCDYSVSYKQNEYFRVIILSPAFNLNAILDGRFFVCLFPHFELNFFCNTHFLIRNFRAAHQAAQPVCSAIEWHGSSIHMLGEL